jgi:hypothetical protein
MRVTIGSFECLALSRATLDRGQANRTLSGGRRSRHVGTVLDSCAAPAFVHCGILLGSLLRRAAAIEAFAEAYELVIDIVP